MLSETMHKLRTVAWKSSLKGYCNYSSNVTYIAHESELYTNLSFLTHKYAYFMTTVLLLPRRRLKHSVEWWQSFSYLKLASRTLFFMLCSYCSILVTDLSLGPQLAPAHHQLISFESNRTQEVWPLQEM